MASCTMRPLSTAKYILTSIPKCHCRLKVPTPSSSQDMIQYGKHEGRSAIARRLRRVRVPFRTCFYLPVACQVLIHHSHIQVRSSPTVSGFEPDLYPIPNCTPEHPIAINEGSERWMCFVVRRQKLTYAVGRLIQVESVS